MLVKKTKNNKKTIKFPIILCIGILCIIAVNKLEVKAETATVNMEELKQKDIYRSILDKYYTAVSERWDSEKLESEGLSSLASPEYGNVYLENRLADIGYSFTDIDSNGVLELLIGTGNSSTIYELYTIVDGRPFSVFSSHAYREYLICANGTILEDYYRNTTEESGRIRYVLSSNGYSLLKKEEIINDNGQWKQIQINSSGTNIQLINQDTAIQKMNQMLSSGTRIAGTTTLTEWASLKATKEGIVNLKPTASIKLTGANRISLNYSLLDGADGYEIYVSYTNKDKDFYLSLESPHPYDQYNMWNMISNRTYYYKVRAFSYMNGHKIYSKYSNTVQKKVIGKPSTPKINAKIENNYFVLTWKKQKNINGIELYRKVGKGSFKRYKKLKAKTTSYRISLKKMKKNQMYSYRIRTYCSKDGITLRSKYSKTKNISYR